MRTRSLTATFAILCVIALLSAHAQNKKEDRTLSVFEKIDVSMACTVYLFTGDVQKVTIDAPESVLKNVETEVENGELEIDIKKGFSSSKGDIFVYITLPKISGIEISGSGVVKGQNAIKADKIGLEVDGSGIIILPQLTANVIETEISGSGKVELTGISNCHNIEISGSGNVNCPAMETKNCEVEISGSGGCHLFATEILNAEISGSGSIKYKGNAKVSSEISGSGSIKAE